MRRFIHIDGNSNFTGDSGYYRCNSKSTIGKRCKNNGISQAKIEQALSSLLTDVVLDFDNLEQVIDRINQRCEIKDTTRLPALVKRSQEVDSQRQKLIDLHLKSLIDEDELKAELGTLMEQKKGLEEAIKQAEAENQAVNISKNDIRKVIENLSQEIQYAAPDKLRMVSNNLFREIKISPKTKKSRAPWSRWLLLKGISIPFTGVKMASPRGFEPLTPE